MQVSAWHGRRSLAEVFAARHSRGDVILVAVSAGGTSAGYCLVEPDGHVDHLYVDPDHRGNGLGTALLRDVEVWGEQPCPASLPSRARSRGPVFARSGYLVEHRRDFEIDGVPIHNFAMRREIR